VIVSDDGLQHLRLARDIEIAVIDGTRRFGNGRCLPPGRCANGESLERCDLRVVNGEPQPGELVMTLAETGLCRVNAPDTYASAGSFRGKQCMPWPASASSAFFLPPAAAGAEGHRAFFSRPLPLPGADVRFGDGLA